MELSYPDHVSHPTRQDATEAVNLTGGVRNVPGSPYPRDQAPRRGERVRGGCLRRQQRRVGAVDTKLVSVLPGQVEKLAPTELLDLLDRRRHDEGLTGLGRSGASLGGVI